MDRRIFLRGASAAALASPALAPGRRGRAAAGPAGRLLGRDPRREPGYPRAWGSTSAPGRSSGTSSATIRRSGAPRVQRTKGRLGRLRIIDRAQLSWPRRSTDVMTYSFGRAVDGPAVSSSARASAGSRALLALAVSQLSGLSGAARFWIRSIRWRRGRLRGLSGAAAGPGRQHRRLHHVPEGRGGARRPGARPAGPGGVARQLAASDGLATASRRRPWRDRRRLAEPRRKRLNANLRPAARVEGGD